MGFFSKLLGKDEWRKTLVRDLVMLTAIDGDMDKDEVALVMKIAVNDLGFSEQKFVDLMQNLGDVKDIYPDDPKDKIEYLQYLLRMTYEDGYVNNNEVEYMKIIAQRMGLPASGIDDAIATVESKAEDMDMNSYYEKDNWSDDFISMYKHGHLFLSNELLTEMYNRVRETKKYGDNLMIDQSADAIQNVIVAERNAYQNAEKVVRWLNAKNITALNPEHIVAAFYLVNLGDMYFKDHEDFTDMEIKNVIATSLSSMGEMIPQPEKLPESSVTKVRIAVRWLLAHPIK